MPTSTVDVTVHYYLVGTTTRLSPDKIINGVLEGSSYTESANIISGYDPDSSSKTINPVTATNNEIAFYYTPIGTPTVDVTVHYVIDGISEYSTGTIPNVTIGGSAVASAISIPGYTPDSLSKTLNNVSATNKDIMFLYTSSPVLPHGVTLAVESLTDGSDTVQGAIDPAKKGFKLTLTIENSANVASVKFYDNGAEIAANTVVNNSIYNHIDTVFGEHKYKVIVTYNDGTTVEAEASGTYKDYTIAKAQDMRSFKVYVEDAKYFPDEIYVIKDFSLNSWNSPIGTEANKFNKTFNGNNKTITVNGANGLFAYNQGTIKNVRIIANINGTENVGGIVAYNERVVENCKTVSGTIKSDITQIDIDSTVKNHGVGGIVGYNYKEATITRCSNLANISCTGNGGGISGINVGGTISNSYNKGNVESTSTRYNRIGGIVGVNGGYGEIYAEATNIWNLIFHASNFKVSDRVVGTIEYCYNTGNIQGKYIRRSGLSDLLRKNSMLGVGGIAGICDDIPISGSITESESAFIEWLRTAGEGVFDSIVNIGEGMWKIRNCYNTGYVKGGNSANGREITYVESNCNGAIIGYNFTNGKTTLATNCFYIEANRRIESMGGINGRDRSLGHYMEEITDRQLRSIDPITKKRGLGWFTRTTYISDYLGSNYDYTGNRYPTLKSNPE